MYGESLVPAVSDYFQVWCVPSTSVAYLVRYVKTSHATLHCISILVVPRLQNPCSRIWFHCSLVEIVETRRVEIQEMTLLRACDYQNCIATSAKLTCLELCMAFVYFSAYFSPNLTQQS